MKTGRILIVGSVLALGSAVVSAWLMRAPLTAIWVAGRTSPGSRPSSSADSSDPSDPRRTYSGPYRNIDPDVRYVGDAACVDCHKAIAASYARHPMGRSLAPAAELADRQSYAPQAHNPFAALGRRFEVERKDKRVWHRQAVLDESGKPAVELAPEAQWVIGSGTRGYSYLTQRDGYLLQTPITWYTQKKRWDLSPGFGEPALAGRVISSACLFCHTNQLREHSEHADRFVAPVFEGHSIGCERCHGPGELHVKGDGGDGEHTIVNPARLSPALRDAVCEQCHLEGEARVLRLGRGVFDFRPGLPLHDFWAVLVQARHSGQDAKAVNHVEQMYQSKCRQRPVGGLTMGCTTCHDPHVHVGPRQRESHYRAACLKCHDEAAGQLGCSLTPPQRRKTSPSDSCIDCHMPRYDSSDISHTALTDHRIVRRKTQPAHPPDGPAAFDGALVVDFYRDRFPRGDAQAERNVGLGMVKMLTAGMLLPERDGDRAVRLLELALARHPRDAELRAFKALALGILHRTSESLSEARLALPKRPGDWRLLAQAASAAQAAGQLDQAVDWGRRSVEINPFVPDNQVSLIAALIRAGRLDEVRLRCDKLLQLDPFNVSGRQTRVGSLLAEGKKAEARKEFELIRLLRPPDLSRREEWFRQQLSKLP